MRNRREDLGMLNVDFSVASAKLESMARTAIAQTPNLIIASVAFVLFWYLSKAVHQGVESVLVRSGRLPPVAKIVGRLAGWLVRILGFMVALTIVMPSLDAASLFGALGVGGVAIGFAFKDIFQNLLAGLLLLITRPFKIGDQIVAGSHEGTVEDIQVRATHLRLFDGRLVVIPNSDLYTGRVEVYPPTAMRRGLLDIGITYDSDIELAKSTILREVAAVEGVARTPAPSVVARRFGDSAVELLLRYWIGPPNRRDLVSTADEIICRLKPALESAGVSIAFPTRVVVVQPQEESPVTVGHAAIAAAS